VYTELWAMGEKFPQCNRCSKLVRLVLVRAAQHAGSNQRFYKVGGPGHDSKTA